MAAKGLLPSALSILTLYAATTSASEDPLAVYTVCLAAGYSHALPTYNDPLESFARARLACETFRESLSNDFKRRGTGDADGVLRALDTALYRRLKDLNGAPATSNLEELEKR